MEYSDSWDRFFDTTIDVNGTSIGDNKPVYIIAEAGVNHNGDVDEAKRLIKLARETGANAVKFQMFYPEELILPTVKKADYQVANSGAGSQIEMLKELALTIRQMEDLKNTAMEEGIDFICTPFEERSLRELCGIGVHAVKIASTDTTNLPFLMEAAKATVPVILSTAMSSWSDVDRAVQVFRDAAKRDIAVLQCTGDYPANPREANLRVISAYRKRYQCVVGLSDHTQTGDVPAVAVALGARVVEKHLTRSRGQSGPDHKASLEPDDFSSMVRAIRRTEDMLGDGIKQITPSEIGTRKSLQKSFVARVDIPAGTRLLHDQLAVLRAGGAGISPVYYREVLNMIVSRDLSAGNVIHWDDVKWS